MAVPIFALLDRLAEQTLLGNVEWQTGLLYPYQYVWHGASSAGVEMGTVDNDGSFPIYFAVLDSNGNRTHYWTVPRITIDSDEREFDDRVRRLWALVSEAHDPVATLVQELEDMPPF